MEKPHLLLSENIKPPGDILSQFVMTFYDKQRLSWSMMIYLWDYLINICLYARL